MRYCPTLQFITVRARSIPSVSLNTPIVAVVAALLAPLGEEPATAEPRPAAAPASVDWIQTLDPKGFYASFGAGAGWPQPVHYSDDRLGPLLPIRGEVLADPGFASERGLGYDFGRLRGELSWVRRQATIDDAGSSWTVGPFRPIVSRDSPTLSSNSGFASLYLDLPIKGTRLIPYLGGGLGVTALQTSPTTLQLRRFSSTFGGSGKLPASCDSANSVTLLDTARKDSITEADRLQQNDEAIGHPIPVASDREVDLSLCPDLNSLDLLPLLSVLDVGSCFNPFQEFR